MPKPRQTVVVTGAGAGVGRAIKHMRRRNRGVIICIGSALAYRSIPFQGALLRRQSGSPRLRQLPAK